MHELDRSLRLVTAHDLVLKVRDDGRRVCRRGTGGAREFLDPLPFELLHAFRAERTIGEAGESLSGSVEVGDGDIERAVHGLYSNGWLHESGEILHRPLVILSTPRAGSTLLFELLSRSTALWTIGGESHSVIESAPHLCPENRGYESHRLTGADADPQTIARLRAGFVTYLRDSADTRYVELPAANRPRCIRLLEKTPRNVLRTPFVAALFPDARFIYLHRDARQSVSSIMEAWRAPGFWQWKGDLPDWDREEWCMLLPPGWQSLVGRPLEDIAAFQWGVSNRIALDDLEVLPRDRWMALDYADLLAGPAECLALICDFAGLPFDEGLRAAVSGPLRPSSSVVTTPDTEKWRKNEAAVERALPSVQDVIDRLAAL